MKRFFLALAWFAPALAFAAELPAVYLIHADALAAARARLAQGDPGLAPALAKLKQDAGRELALKPLSVMDKTRIPPSGDKHDYVSQGPYWWPDPAKPNGLPYIRHDGVHNPEVDRGTDNGPWGRVAGAVSTLGLAYYFTRDEAYAGHAALLVRTWFLDPATRMNPNLNFGQGIPGIVLGRGEGVLAMRDLASVCDGLALLAGSPAWTAADDRAFHAWLAAYFDWVTQDKVGLEEKAARNNHGSWYDMQVADLALVLGRPDFARRILADGLAVRVPAQITPEGQEPLELVRTKSMGYAFFNLRALTDLAILSEQVGVDWWAPREGRSLRTAVRYHAAFVDPAKPWPQKDIQAGGREELLPILAEALRHGDDPEYRDLLRRFGETPAGRGARWRLLYDIPAKS